MKNLFKIFGIIAVVALVGFTMIACEEAEDNPFVGTWEGEMDDGDTVKIVAKDTTWEMFFGASGNVVAMSGSYTYTGNVATMTGTFQGTAFTITSTLSSDGDKINTTILGEEVELTRVK